MLLPVFSSNTLLCIDPATITYLTYTAITIGAGITTAVTNKIIESYNQPPENIAIVAADKVKAAVSNEQLNFITARANFGKCAAASKPEGEKILLVSH